jgi:hypothetical protein
LRVASAISSILCGDALVAAAQASVSEAKPLTLGKRAKLLQMEVRARRQQKTAAEMFGIGDIDRELVLS